MKGSLLVAVLCAMIVVGCAKKQDATAQKGAPGDTVRTADSTRSADSTRAVDSTHAADSTRAADSSAQAPPAKLLSYEEAQGASIYGKYCAVCHGVEGKGDGFNAFNLDPHPRDFSDSTYMKALSDDQIVQTVMGGGRSVNKSPLMPAYGWTLNRQQIRYVVSCVRSFMKQ